MQPQQQSQQPSTIITFLNKEEAQEIDKELMSPSVGYSIQQLMELAGLSVAQSIMDCFPLDTFRRVIVVCGPGNNGGDGLVAARHLRQFGYIVEVCYPKPSQKAIYTDLMKQLEQYGVHISKDFSVASGSFDLIVDAVFGFSFSGEIRPPFDSVLKEMNESGIKRVAVDIPSGWDVEEGDSRGLFTPPECVVSLMLPKRCMETCKFSGTHYLGGRFIPDAVRLKYGFKVPHFPGSQQFVRLQ